jgi:septal ring factor EnvC (AmiA/AmiB activator)
MLGVLNTNKDFLKAFEEDGDDDSDSRQMKRGSRTSVNNLLTELQQYEESLAKERAAVEHERGEIAVERESLNTMLDSEMAKNQDLQYQILEMRKEVDQQAVMLA